MKHLVLSTITVLLLSFLGVVHAQGRVIVTYSDGSEFDRIIRKKELTENEKILNGVVREFLKLPTNTIGKLVISNGEATVNAAAKADVPVSTATTAKAVEKTTKTKLVMVDGVKQVDEGVLLIEHSKYALIEALKAFLTANPGVTITAVIPALYDKMKMPISYNATIEVVKKDDKIDKLIKGLHQFEPDQVATIKKKLKRYLHNVAMTKLKGLTHVKQGVYFVGFSGDRYNKVILEYNQLHPNVNILSKTAVYYNDSRQEIAYLFFTDLLLP